MTTDPNEKKVWAWLERTGRALTLDWPGDSDEAFLVIHDKADEDMSDPWVYESFDPMDPPWGTKKAGTPEFWEWVVERLDSTRVGWEDR